MGIGPEEASRMDLWTYTALLHHWNVAQGGGEEPVELPSADRVRRSFAEAQDRGMLH